MRATGDGPRWALVVQLVGILGLTFGSLGWWNNQVTPQGPLDACTRRLLFHSTREPVYPLDQGWATLMIKRATIFHHHHQRATALHLIGYMRSYQIIKNKSELCVDICRYQ